MASAAAPATAPAAGKRKRDLSEDDLYLILHKYPPAVILTALQEVSQHADKRRIDWRALVAKTATGITSAREYQMLWRYMAYRHDFVESVDAGAQPLGDESDLECEIEPSPNPSNEALAEASGFAKILMYGSSREQGSNHRANSEVPLLSTPNEKIPRVPSDKQLAQSHRLTNGTGPVSNSKLASHTGLSPDPFDGNGPHKKTKKPKAWTKEEDADLTAGVHKCGEGNWLDILHKYNFDNTRTPVQLSQRWAFISKRQGTIKPGKAKPVSGGFDIKATQKAFSMALDMPMGKPGSFTLRSGTSQQSTQHPAPVFGAAAPELKSATSSSSLPLPVPVPIAAPLPVPVKVQAPLPRAQQAPAQAAPSRVSNTSNKPRNGSKKQTAQANPTNAPSSIQAAAIAAGGRIATPSVATNLLKAAQSAQAVRIRSRGKGSSKTSTSAKASTMASEPGTQLVSAQHAELPNCSSPTASPPVLIAQSTEQVNAVPEVTGVNTPEKSASAPLLEPDRALSTTSVSGPCDNMEMDDDSTFCVVTMEDLFPEDAKQPETVNQPETVKQPEVVKQPEMVDPKAEEIIDPKDADMLEFDRFVAHGCLTTDYLDKSKGVKIAPGAQGPSASQKKQPKQPPTVGKSIPVFARTSATLKTKTLASHGATFPPAVTSGGLVGTGNAGVLSKAIYRKPPGPGTTDKQNRCQEIMAQKQHAMNTNSSAMAKNVAPGTVAAAKNVAPGTGAAAKNAAPGTGTAAKNAAPGTGAAAKNAAPATGTLARNAAPGTGTAPARNSLTGTGTAPARNSLTGTGTPPTRSVAPGTGTPSARNSLTGTGTPPARNSLTGTGTPPARNVAPGIGTPAARNSLTSTGTPGSRQYNTAVNVTSKGNPPASQ